MTAHGSIDSAVEAMRKGAFDYLTKPLDRDVLLLAVSRALERTRLVSENLRLREELRGRFRVENLVGAHGSMQEVFRVVHKVARSTSTVLIYGESGTGKELVARAIHVTSDRRDRPFLAVNVAALPETILEAELFGYEKGAFTGADARKIGLFEHASGSTLFLDEVGELKRDLQVKLLRTLQEREVLRVGGTEPVPVDVRVVAATNRDLEREVKEGALPRGPLLPPQRHPDRAPAAARAAHRHPAPRRALPRQARRARAKSERSLPRRSRPSSATPGRGTCGSSSRWSSGRCCWRTATSFGSTTSRRRCGCAAGRARRGSRSRSRTRGSTSTGSSAA